LESRDEFGRLPDVCNRQEPVREQRAFRPIPAAKIHQDQ